MTRSTQEAVRNAIALTVVLLLCQQTSSAQVDPWERVRLIEGGKKVQVKLRSGKTVNGTMEAWSADSLTVRQGEDRVLQVTRSDVTEVAFLIGKSRKRKAAWAGGIVGVGLGSLVVLSCAAENCVSGSGEMAFVAALATAFYGGIAAGIAALFPPHKEVLYEAEPPAEPPPAGSMFVVLRASRDSAAVVKSGQTLRIQVALRDAGGKNPSSPRIRVQALEVSAGPGSSSLPARPAGNAKTGSYFVYSPRTGDSGGYVFELSTEGLAPGDYALTYKADLGTETWSAPFQVR